MTRKVKHLRQEFQDGTFVEVVAYEVQTSEQYPEEYKYRFRYGTSQETILRYDNSHGKHDRHFGGTREHTDFEGLEEHLETFFKEVENLRRDGITTPEEVKNENRKEQQGDRNRDGGNK